MAWVYLVLAKKGASETVIERIRNLYSESISVTVVNNVQGRAFQNLRGSLRQGDIPSMFWFAVGIDPLLLYLEKRLRGIPISSLPVLGPTQQHETSATMPPVTQKYKLVAYADDVKPAISTMEEFYLVDRACTLLERASGVKLPQVKLNSWLWADGRELSPRRISHTSTSDCLITLILLEWS